MNTVKKKKYVVKIPKIFVGMFIGLFFALVGCDVGNSSTESNNSASSDQAINIGESDCVVECRFDVESGEIIAIKRCTGSGNPFSADVNSLDECDIVFEGEGEEV